MKIQKFHFRNTQTKIEKNLSIKNQKTPNALSIVNKLSIDKQQ